VLTEFAPPPVDIYAVYPHNRHLSAKVRAFIDHYVDWLRQRRQEMPFS
jgi:DNA-binding transcriptional LysR family regulator